MHTSKSKIFILIIILAALVTIVLKVAVDNTGRGYTGQAPIAQTLRLLKPGWSDYDFKERKTTGFMDAFTSDMNENTGIEFGKSIYRSKQPFWVSYGDFEVTVHDVELIETVNSESISNINDRNYMAFLILNMSLNNQTQENVYMETPEYIRIDDNRTMHRYLYSPGEDLLEIKRFDLSTNQDKELVKPGDEIKGYLVFGVNELDYKIMEKKGWASLEVPSIYFNDSSSLEKDIHFIEASRLAIPLNIYNEVYMERINRQLEDISI